MTTATIPEIVQLLEDCVERESRMNDWELKFVADMVEQIDRGRCPTEKQRETINNIWEKVTEGG